MDNGKPYKVAYHGDICFFAKFMRYYAGWCDKITGQTIPVGQYSSKNVYSLNVNSTDILMAPCILFRLIYYLITNSYSLIFGLNILNVLDGNFFTYTRREPIGVIGAIIPVSLTLLKSVNI